MKQVGWSQKLMPDRVQRTIRGKVNWDRNIKGNEKTSTNNFNKYE